MWVRVTPRHLYLIYPKRKYPAPAPLRRGYPQCMEGFHTSRESPTTLVYTSTPITPKRDHDSPPRLVPR